MPGAEIVEKGLAALSQGRETDESLLVSIAATKLDSLGLAVPSPFVDADRRLYRRLARADPDSAHSRYNALVRRLVSFERALAALQGRHAGAGGR